MQFCDLKYYEYVADHEYKQDFEMHEIWSEKERLESKITPRFRAEETGLFSNISNKPLTDLGPGPQSRITMYATIATYWNYQYSVAYIQVRVD